MKLSELTQILDEQGEPVFPERPTELLLAMFSNLCEAYDDLESKYLHLVSLYNDADDILEILRQGMSLEDYGNEKVINIKSWWPRDPNYEQMMKFYKEEGAE